MSNDFHLLNKIQLPDAITSIYPLEKLVFIDIETTGFSHRHSHIINLGLLFYKTNWEFNQLWASDEREELILLTHFMGIDEPDRIYICYNGRSFDFPFIMGRLKHHHFLEPSFKHRIIDFMPLGRQYAKAKNLSSYTLKAIESSLGIERDHDLTGQEVVEAFLTYKYSRDTGLKEKILRHNAQDILNMPHLLYTLSKETNKDLTALLPIVLTHRGHSIALTLTWSHAAIKLTGVTRTAYSIPQEIVEGFHLKIVNHTVDITLPLIHMPVEHHHFTRLDWSLCYPERPPYDALSLDKKMQLILKTNDYIHLENIRDLILDLFDHYVRA